MGMGMLGKDVSWDLGQKSTHFDDDEKERGFPLLFGGFVTCARFADPGQWCTRGFGCLGDIF